MTCCTEGGAEEEVKLPLLTGVGDGHGDALFKHHSTFSPRVLGALLQVPVPAVGPVPLMVACTHPQTSKTAIHIHCLDRCFLTMSQAIIAIVNHMNTQLRVQRCHHN